MNTGPIKILLFLVMFTMTKLSYGQNIDIYSRPLQTERSREYDAIHYRIKLRFDEERKVFWGVTTITISPFSDGFTQCVLDAETFTVTSAQDEKGHSLDYEQNDGQVLVTFAESYDYGDTLSFIVRYDSEEAAAEAKKQERSRRTPGIAFFDASDTHPAIVEAISWPIGARHWYPCYDHPNDKATQEVLLTVRSDYQALSNGRLVGVSENKADDTKTFHWSMDRPHSTYLSMFAAGPYEVIRDSLGSLPINYWVYRKDRQNALRSFHKTPRIIAFFNQAFGYPYPWSKYDQVIQPGFGGGMECTTATLIGEGTIHDERAEQDFPSHGLVAHEAAHQWWGDLVTLRDWGHTWINEGFGTYFDYVFARYDLGEDEGAVNLLGKKDSYLNEARNRYMRPIVFHRWNRPQQNFDSHTYPKAAVVLHMMRWILGETPFKKTLSHFLHKHAFGPADTDDFLTAIKESTGQNLDWFFDQWFYKPGHPVFQVGYAWNPGTRHVNMRIAQVQDTSTGVPIFQMPVVIGIVIPKGRLSQKVWLKRRVEEFHFPCDEKPLMVRFDEGNNLLKEWTFEKSLDELLYQLAQDDVIGRMWAARELGKREENARIVGGLMKSGRGDPFWAVRREAVNALGGYGNARHISFFKQKARDENSKVRTASLGALGDMKNTGLVPFFKERFEKDDSYVAQAEALHAIGKCGQKSDKLYLEKVAEMKSPRNVLGRAVAWALKQLENKN